MEGQHEHGAPEPPEEPHDVLAAEAFAVGAGDPGLHQEPAHDVLAADEFPVPASPPHAVPPDWQPPSQASSSEASGTAVAPRASRVRRLAPVVLVAGLALVLLKRRRGRAAS